MENQPGRIPHHPALAAAKRRGALHARMADRHSSAVHSLFVSDVHFGCRYADVAALCRLLHWYRPEKLYLVGDIFDGWRLKSRWYWNRHHDDAVSRLLDLIHGGTRIYYTPGNHDEFLRRFLGRMRFDFLEVANEFIHETAVGKYYLVTHGDKFDSVETRAPWLSFIGSFAYDTLIWSNHQFNRLRRTVGLADWCYSKYAKSTVKQAVKFISDFEENLASHARSLGCDGVICGHIHTPAMTHRGGIEYCNTGDWIENRCAIVEYDDGQLELIFADDLPPHPPEHDLPAAASTRLTKPVLADLLPEFASASSP